MRGLLVSLAIACLNHAASAQTRPPQVFTPTAVAGKQSRIGFFYAINPDCTTRGEIERRVLKMPEHGDLEIAPGDSYPFTAEKNQWYHCNERAVPGLLILYKPEQGYAGKDHFDIEFIGPLGGNFIWKYVVTVK